MYPVYMPFANCVGNIFLRQYFHAYFLKRFLKLENDLLGYLTCILFVQLHLF